MNISTQIINFLQKEEISYIENMDLKKKTWIRRGGIASIWVQPTKMVDFEKLIIWCQLNQIKFEVIGNTSNCYFVNDYHPLLVISTLRLTKIHETENTIICDCGYNMARFAKHCIAKGHAGYEGFIGLPGTVGGAAVNNAGCYGSLISNILKGVIVIQNGKKIEFSSQELKYSHRTSVLKSKEIEGVVTKVIFDISQKENSELLKKKANEYQQHRKKYQEHSYPNLGSTFCHLELKKYPLGKRIINVVLLKVILFFSPSKLLRQQLKVKLFWSLNKARSGNVKNYVSKHGIQCFVWKDENADSAFIDYVDFIERITRKAVIEIDIKK